MKKLAVLFSVLALAAFGFTACGDDDDDDSAADTATTEETTEAGGGGGGGSTVEVTSTEGISYDQTSLEAPAGETVTFNFTNDAGIEHDFVIEDSQGTEIGGTDVITSGSTTLEAELAAGEYTFFCSVPGHREGGMEGPLTVE